jgi:hypothetical protein
MATARLLTQGAQIPVTKKNIALQRAPSNPPLGAFISELGKLTGKVVPVPRAVQFPSFGANTAT